jgi:hypothetical protein
VEEKLVANQLLRLVASLNNLILDCQKRLAILGISVLYLTLESKNLQCQKIWCCGRYSKKTTEFSHNPVAFYYYYWFIASV